MIFQSSITCSKPSKRPNPQTAKDISHLYEGKKKNMFPSSISINFSYYKFPQRFKPFMKMTANSPKTVHIRDREIKMIFYYFSSKMKDASKHIVS